MGGFDEIRAEATKDRASVRVCFDRALVAQLEDAERRLGEARDVATSGIKGGRTLGETSEVTSLERQVGELKHQVLAKSRTLVFESIGNLAWRKLLSEHPPTDEQKQQLGGSLGGMLPWNPETFPVAALVASCSDPGLTTDDARWIVDELPQGVTDRIWAACLRANVTGSRDPLGDSTDAALAGAKK